MEKLCIKLSLVILFVVGIINNSIAGYGFIYNSGSAPLMVSGYETTLSWKRSGVEASDFPKPYPVKISASDWGYFKVSKGISNTGYFRFQIAEVGYGNYQSKSKDWAKIFPEYTFETFVTVTRSSDIPAKAQYITYYGEDRNGAGFYTFSSYNPLPNVKYSSEGYGAVENAQAKDSCLVPIFGIDEFALGHPSHAPFVLYIWCGSKHEQIPWLKELESKYFDDFISKVKEPRDINKEFDIWINSQYPSSFSYERRTLTWFHNMMNGEARDVLLKEISKMNSIKAIVDIIDAGIMLAFNYKTFKSFNPVKLQNIKKQTFVAFKGMVGLDVSNDYTQPLGSYLKNCTNIYWDSDNLILTADCETTEKGKYQPSVLHFLKCFSTKYSFYVESINGNLSCEPSSFLDQ